MSKIELNMVNSLLFAQDQYKNLLFNCTNKTQEKQVRSKLKKINNELENIYIN